VATTSAIRPRRRQLTVRGRPVTGFEIVVGLIGVLVGATVIVTLGRLAVWTWNEYGTSIPHYYAHDVFGDAAVRRMLIDTAIVVVSSSFLATVIAAVLAWLNERTDASIGTFGRVLPLIPFLMPAIALPLGWVFLASPAAGGLNIVIRAALGLVGIHKTTGPLAIYGWPGLIFLYTIFLCGFAYLVISGSMRSLDRGLEEAAQLAGAGPAKILFRVVLPAVKPALYSAFLMTVIVAVVMVSVPITIGSNANINILSVTLVNLVTTQTPPQYGQAFLLGLLLLIPILLALWLQRRTAARGRFAAIGGRVSLGRQMRLGRRGKVIGRTIFLGYILIAVVLPVLGLLFVAGQDFWSGVWPAHWNPIPNIRGALNDSTIRSAILTSVGLGVGGGVLLVVIAQILAYGQRLFPRLGRIVDVLVKTPAIVAQILVAISLLVTLGGAPFNLGTTWLLLIGYVIVFLPFASVMANAGQQQIGGDVVEAAMLVGSSPLRTFRSIVTPLSRSSQVACFLLMYVLISGETNVSLILASTQRPVVGFVMLDLFNFASYPQVASFALVITAVNLVCIAVGMKLLSGRNRVGVA
jgi:iron(III) transport system permease protein